MEKSALITGAARRLGKIIALHLAKAGYNIALHYNQSKEDAEAVAHEISLLNRKVHLYQSDLSNLNDSRVLIKTVVRDFPELDLLLNNASIFFKHDFLENNNKDIQETLNINFLSPYILSQEFATICKKGNIINILDTKISKLDTPYFLYTLSKKMLKDLTLMSAKTLAPDIRVNGICPGHIILEEKNEMSYLTMKAESIPLLRNAKEEDIIKSVVFLLDNKFVTGQLIYIDGGENLN